jgi:hypothetical protein
MPKTYEPIATNTLGSAAASVTFSSIAATYTDLVLVMSYSLSVGSSSTFIQFNGDTATNYSNTYLSGGSSATSGRDTSATRIRCAAPAVGTGINAMRSTLISIQNYANTTTYKTLLSRDNQAADEVAAIVGLWRATPAAINSIYLFNGASANFTTGSTFTLYGIKAA